MLRYRSGHNGAVLKTVCLLEDTGVRIPRAALIPLKKEQKIVEKITEK